MKCPSDLQYTKEHEWIKIEGKTGTVGITHYAIEQLGDVVYLELPKVGAKFSYNDTFGTIESTKTVSDLFMPVTGVVSAINKKVVDTPELLSTDAYKEGWLIKVDIESTPGQLLSAEEYEKYLVSHA